MKRKRITTTLISSAIAASAIITPIMSMSVLAADPLQQNSFTENGNTNIPVSCDVKSGYRVILPAQVILEKSAEKYAKSFSPGVIGNIDSDKFVIVRPKSDTYALNDASNVRSVNANITQNDVSWSADELGLGESIIEKDASTEAELTLAGSYSGEIEYEFYLSNEDVLAAGAEIPGVYDANGTLLANWEDTGVDGTCSNGYTLNGNYPTATKLVLPEGITTLSDGAFASCRNLEEVVLPDSLTRIGNSCFDRLPNLTSVKMGKNVESIGISAFAETKISSIDIPETVKTIERNAFFGCTELTSIDVSGVEVIDYMVFQSCSKLTNVKVSDNLKIIRSGSFIGSGITSMEIPANVELIEKGVFTRCNNLTSLVFKDPTNWVSTSTYGKGETERDPSYRGIDLSDPAATALSFREGAGDSYYWFRK